MHKEEFAELFLERTCWLNLAVWQAERCYEEVTRKLFVWNLALKRWSKTAESRTVDQR